MEMRRLGRTDLQVSVLSIGGLYTSSLAGGVAETKRIIDRAIELGINAIDTAPAYADSESTVGTAIGGNNSLIVTTKLGGKPQPFDARDADSLRFSVEDSLRVLGRDHIDLLMIHEPDRPQQYPWWTNYDPLQGPVLDVMNECKEKGLVRFIGLAGTTVTELDYLVRSNLFDVVLTAFNYNVLFREARPTVIESAKQRDMGIVLGSALGQGFLTRRADNEVANPPLWLSQQRAEQFRAYYELLDQAAMPAYELCLRFAIGDPVVSTIPVGCKTMQHLESSVEAVNKGPLSSDILERLDQIAEMVPQRPFEEPMILPLQKDYSGPGIANMGSAVQVGKLDNA